MADSDDSYDFRALDGFIAALRGGADLVVGNRFRGGIQSGAMPWKNRYIGNPVLSGLGRLLFGTPIRDFHCGIRAFSRAAFARMDLRTTGMEFATEMVIKATLLGMNVVEVPTTLAKDGRSRPPHLRPWRDGWRHLRFMLLFSPNWVFLYPGLALMTIGLVCGGTLIANPVTFHGLRFSLGTLIYCVTMVEVGFQAAWFALLAQAYVVQAGLMPVKGRLRLVDRVVTLERGILSGTLLVMLGMALLAHAMAVWAEAGFGTLNVNEIVRIVIGSSLAISMGFQVVLSSFLLGTLRLGIHPKRVPGTSV
jgi:hypothetical protein